MKYSVEFWIILSTYLFYFPQLLDVFPLVGIPKCITSSAIGLKICVITAEIKKV